MSGELIQTAKIFDPRQAPEYLKQCALWSQSVAILSDSNRDYLKKQEKHIANFDLKKLAPHIVEAPATPRLPKYDTALSLLADKSLQDWEKINSGFYLGESLYPKTLDYLTPLHISWVDTITSHLKKGPEIPGRYDFETIKTMIPFFYTTWPLFRAYINPEIPVGEHIVHIFMCYSSDDDLTPEKHQELVQLYPEFEDPEYPFHYDNRTIEISAPFHQAKTAQIGLNQLKILYPEMILEEELYAFRLPQSISDQYKKARQYANSYYFYNTGISNNKPAERYDKKHEKNMTLKAWIDHLEFIREPIKKMELVLKSAEYNSLASDLDITEEISTINDLIDLVRSPNYDSVHLPKVKAEFHDQKIEIEIKQSGPSINYTGNYDRAIYVTADSSPVLYALLGKIEST